MVTKDDLISILQSFKKDRSPRLDGWRDEFFIGFFEIINDDLLRVLEEV